jgi:hypothetical protein
LVVEQEYYYFFLLLRRLLLRLRRLLLRLRLQVQHRVYVQEYLDLPWKHVQPRAGLQLLHF